jgi:superfamily II DNA or RNA helicase
MFPRERLCLIADEVHHAGAPFFSNVLKHDFAFRMGLSVTPDRDWDEVGQDKIDKFFGGMVYRYTLKQALDDDVLCKYEYHIATAVLRDDEIQTYLDISKDISRKFAFLLSKYPKLRGLSFQRVYSEIASSEPEEFRGLQSLIIARANILKRSKSKNEPMREIVRKHDLGRCLIYCNDTVHLDDVNSELSDLGQSAVIYDYDLSEDEKARNMKAFYSGNTKYMIAIRCLDEGVDIPVCDSAILLSSSRSTREFIQRRGRAAFSGSW